MLREGLSYFFKSCCDETSDPSHAPSLSIALVGNPNCGKTTLFNALTGARQQVGNWPGVTVEKKSGLFVYMGTMVEVVDLPGVYGLMQTVQAGAVDERIAHDFIVERKAD